VANGWIAANGSAGELAVAAVREGLAVARAQGIDLEDSLLDGVLDVASRTAANTSSMLQDVLQRRPTEIEAINGAVVAHARASGLEAPVNWTLTQLVRTLQASYLQPEGSAYRRSA
jgi:2-dehydropantoate 2-reductase